MLPELVACYSIASEPMCRSRSRGYLKPRRVHFDRRRQDAASRSGRYPQSPAKRKIKCADWIVRPGVCLIQPITNGSFAVPAFADCIRLESSTVTQRPQFLNRTHHPAAVAFHHVVAESVETNFFEEPPCITDQLSVNQRSAVTEIRAYRGKLRRPR